MTTAPGSFTSRPTRVPEGVALTFDGVRMSAPDPGLEPITPTTEGYWTVTVRTITAVPASVLDAVAGSVTVGTNGEITAINQAQALPVLRALIRPSDRQEFEKLVNDSDRVVDIKSLWAAAMHAVQELTGRPTGGSGD